MKFLNIAIRNLSRQKKRNILLGGAIAFGVLMITLVNTFTAGISSNVKDSFSQLLAGHVYVSETTKREDDVTIDQIVDETPVIEALAELGIGNDAILRRSTMGSTLIFNGKTAAQQITGVDWSSETELQERLNFAEGSIEDVLTDPRGLVISGDAAERLEIQLGEEVTVRTSTVTDQENVGTLVVRGILVTSTLIGSISSYTNLDRVNELINLAPGSYQDLRIYLPAIEMTDAVTDQLYAILSENYQTEPREDGAFSLADINSGFTFREEEEEEWSGSRYSINNINDFTTVIDQLSATLNNIGLGILIVLVIITMVGVSNTFRMVMFERVKEVGTMRAVGVQRSGVRSIFLWEALGLGTLGYLLGIALTFLAIALLQLITVPTDNPFNLFTFNGTLTFPLNFTSVLFNYVLMVGFTVLAASIPASAAAKLSPSDALRN